MPQEDITQVAEAAPVPNLHKPLTLAGLEAVIKGKLQPHVSNVHIAVAMKDIGEFFHHVLDRLESLEHTLATKVQTVTGAKTTAAPTSAKPAAAASQPAVAEKPLVDTAPPGTTAP